VFNIQYCPVQKSASSRLFFGGGGGGRGGPGSLTLYVVCPIVLCVLRKMGGGGEVALHAPHAAAPTNKTTVGLNNELTPWSLTFSSLFAKEIGSPFIESDKRRSG
jgi:hypothetical protein